MNFRVIHFMTTSLTLFCRGDCTRTPRVRPWRKRCQVHPQESQPAQADERMSRRVSVLWTNAHNSSAASPSASREIDEASRSLLVFQTSRMICIDMQICEQ